MTRGVKELNELRRRYLEFFVERGHLAYPSASLKSDDPTLMFTSAGMVQFKPYFLGATPKFAGYEGVWHRVTTAQKCLRINDIENVGRTLRHHSFFEMLGNFSFGDYFKREACRWAWEFSTSEEWLGLDPERLYVTVYEDDDEAFRIWRDEVGVPERRISRWGEDENFWPANAVTQGPNGPCGPCSEVFYDRGPDYGTPDEDGPNTGSGDRFVEYWNLVFTQFDRQDGGVLQPLPQKNIDTGLGFERLAALMTGQPDAYGTELFQPTIRRVAELSGRPYEGTRSLSHRVIADHVRAVTFAITDGVLPANDGAGYVVKMLIRRAARHAWLLGLRDTVLHGLVDQVIAAMGEPYPEIVDGRDRVMGVIETEEEQFLRTLEAGIERVGNLLDELEGNVLPGEVAFDLWQTYGFPLDLTQELAAERGVDVDRAGYEAAREEARRASRGDLGERRLFTAQSDALGAIAGRSGDTEFLGYTESRAEATVVGLVREGQEVDVLREGDSGVVVLDRTPFYAEGGGQVGDVGKLEWAGGAALVSGTSRSTHGLHLHEAKVVRGELAPGTRLTAQVDPAREQTKKHHTATHLLHAALRTVLGTHVTQAGSLVAPDRLRFDFTHGRALAPEELRRVEELVNRWVQQDLAVSWRVVPIAEARQAGAMMLFGEKYGENVRMVSVGGAERPVSIELCGGTHVASTGTIGAFVITSEEAVSAGVRRVEARVGMAAIEYLEELRARERRMAESLGVSPAQLEARVAKLTADLKEAQREAARLRDRLAAALTSAAPAAEVREAGGFRFATFAFDGLDAQALRGAADRQLEATGADVVVVGSGQLLVAKTSADARARGADAGKLVRAVSGRVGGGGGGKPDLAQAGIKDPARLGEALAAVPEVLAALPA
ncbi:MAG TPA: alanine--tRNA ligase [Trueperaceae bacterium]